MFFTLSPKLREIEGRVCFVLTILMFLVMFASFSVVTVPIASVFMKPYSEALCKTEKFVTVYGITNCTWASCDESCTTDSFVCEQLFVRFKLNTSNSSSVVPLYDNIFHCGLQFVTTCNEFYKTYVELGTEFWCDVYLEELSYAVPNSKSNRVKLITSFLLSLIPILCFIMFCVYLKLRNILSLKVTKIVKKVKKKVDGPKSFYHKKLLEIEFKKKLREIKMKHVENDIKIFDLEDAQTASALVLKPKDLWFRKDTIVI